MRIGLWEIVRLRILTPLTNLCGPDDSLLRLFTTIGYAFISALAVLLVGFLMYLITLINVFPAALPLLIMLLIGFVLAVTTVTYNDVPCLTPRVWTVAFGIGFFLVLLTANAVFQIVNYLGFIGYFFYIFFMSALMTVVYWFFTDFYAKFSATGE